jgi:hypothetical protein
MQPPSSAPAGQISADGQFRWDGQQWVPIERGYREPTPWTRPMQLATAAIFACSAVVSLATTFVYINHDSMLKSIQASGSQLPAGTNVNDVVNAAIAFTYAIVIFFVVLDVVAAIGSYLRWRWMFWAALVLFGLSSIGALTNLRSISQADSSPVPVAGLIVSEIFSLISLAMFIWMIVGLIKYGPWAMRKPGAR